MKPKKQKILEAADITGTFLVTLVIALKFPEFFPETSIPLSPYPLIALLVVLGLRQGIIEIVRVAREMVSEAESSWKAGNDSK